MCNTVKNDEASIDDWQEERVYYWNAEYTELLYTVCDLPKNRTYVPGGSSYDEVAALIELQLLRDRIISDQFITGFNFTPFAQNGFHPDSKAGKLIVAQALSKRYNKELDNIV